MNDGILQWAWNGSMGKRLAVIVLRSADGEPLDTPTILLRPFAKLLLLPVAPLAFLDALGQAPHDKLMSTRVLKGRPVY
jgi:uncharacterized RDD family membrane protein YckC